MGQLEDKENGFTTNSVTTGQQIDGYDLIHKNNIPAPVVSLKITDIEVRVRIGNEDNSFITLQIPNGFENSDLLKLCIFYLNTTTFKKLSTGYRSSLSSIYSSFFKWIESFYSKETFHSETGVILDYLNHLKSIGSDEQIIYQTLQRLKSFLQYFVSAKNKPHKSWNITTKEIHRRWPKIQKPKYEPEKALSQLYSEFDYDDESLIVGLREYSVWFLQEWMSIRNKILQKSVLLKKFVSNVSGQYSIDDDYFSKLPSGNHRSKEKPSEYWIQIWRELLSVIISNKNDFPHLIELISFIKKENQVSIRKNYEVKSFEWCLEYSSKITNNNPKYSPFRKDISIKGTRSKVPEIQVISPMMLILPTKAEQNVMGWLLASERVQQSGVKNLKTDQIYLSENEVQITNFQKFRSPKNNNKSPIYKKTKHNSIYKTYKDWVELIENANKKIPLKNINFVIPQYEETNLNIFGNTTRPSFMLAGVKNSQWRKKLLNDFKEEKNEHQLLKFIKIIEVMAKKLAKRASQQSNYDKARKIYEENGKTTTAKSIKRSVFFDTGYNGISISSIAQSKTLIDGDASTPEEMEILAKLNAHSLKTEHETYIDRSTTKSVVDRAINFAALVGEKMELEARKFTNINDVNFLTIEEAKSILGVHSSGREIEDELKDIIQEAEIQNYFIDITLEMSKEGKSYVIMSPLTAAMLLGYIEHIDENIDEIFMDSEIKGKKTLIKKAQIVLMLEKFPKKTVALGRGLLSEYKIPFPPLV